jgi:hypothetical protein
MVIGCRDGTSAYPFSRVAILNPKQQFFRHSLASHRLDPSLHAGLKNSAVSRTPEQLAQRTSHGIRKADNPERDRVVRNS